MRLIDADALASVLGIHEDCDDCENHESGLFCKKGGDFVTACEAIYDAPTIEPERKKGKWIKNDNGTYSCGICQSWIPEEQHCYARYCLYCGSEMRGDRND